MWYVEVSLSKWLKLYPSLRFRLDLTCSKCSVKRVEPKPFVHKDFVGVRFDKCERCGKMGEMIIATKNKEDNKKYKKLFSEDF